MDGTWGNPLVDAEGAANMGIEDPDNVGTELTAAPLIALLSDPSDLTWPDLAVVQVIARRTSGLYADITGDDAAKMDTMYTPVPPRTRNMLPSGDGDL